MTATPWNSQTLTTLTLPAGKWETIRTAVLCFAVDERLNGNHKESEHFFKAFKALREAMGD